MNLSGHRIITRKAIEEVERRLKGNRQWATSQMLTKNPSSNTHKVSSSKELVGPAHFAVQRDLMDVVSLGHWRNTHQKHHFMRRTDRQTPYQAWGAGCAWVEQNIQEFARAVALNDGPHRLQKLGNALHAVEDSFSRSHVTREPFAAGNPGEIKYIHVFELQNAAEHALADLEWHEQPWVLDLAAAACVDLVSMVFDEISATTTGSFQRLQGFNTFRDKWLKPSPKLAKQGAYEIDLIDAHSDGADLDEQALALSLFSAVGTRTDQVARVFERLDKYDNTNADDVGRHYVDMLRRNPGGMVTRAVARDANLKQLLVHIFGTGAVSGKDASSKAFLEQLR
jgi:hypothetical protein